MHDVLNVYLQACMAKQNQSTLARKAALFRAFVRKASADNPRPQIPHRTDRQILVHFDHHEGQVALKILSAMTRVTQSYTKYDL